MRDVAGLNISFDKGTIKFNRTLFDVTLDADRDLGADGGPAVTNVPNCIVERLKPGA